MVSSISRVEQAKGSKEGRQYLEDLWRRTTGHRSIDDLPLRTMTSWRGWSVGSYVHALGPTKSFDVPSHVEQMWQKHPVLLIDVVKQGPREAGFLVAYLYDRRTAAQRSKMVAGLPRWRASISLRTWPREHTYVLSNHFEIVYEWDLRVWSRSIPPSVATHRTFDICTSRLVRSGTELSTVMRRALTAKLSFRHFLRLPREIRDSIYEYWLLDERQMTSHSRIYTHSLFSKHIHHEKGWPWQCSPISMPTPYPLPHLHTPSILRVCKQIRHEALDALYRTKTLVITVTSIKDMFCDLQQSWMLSISRFLRIRIDLIMACISAEAMLESFCRIAMFLRQHALSLQRLEFRIGYSYANASAAVRDHGLALIVSPDDVAASMCQLVPLFQERNRQTKSQATEDCKMTQISWGVNEVQMRMGDFSCHCSYLSPDFLRHMWEKVHRKTEDLEDEVALQLSEQDCRQFGCKYHCR